MLRQRHLGSTFQRVDTINHCSTDKMPHIGSDVYDRLGEPSLTDERLDQHRRIGITWKDGYANHQLNRSNLCDGMGQRAAITKEGYANYGLKRRNLCEDVDPRTVIGDKDGTLNYGLKRKSLCEDIGWRTATVGEHGNGSGFSEEDRILGDSVRRDLRAKLLRDSKKDDFIGNLNERLGSKRLHMLSEVPRQSDFRADCKESLNIKDSRVHFQHGHDSENPLAGIHRSDRTIQAQKRNQLQEKLKVRPVLDKNWISKQGFKNACYESQNVDVQNTDEFNDYMEETSVIPPGKKMAGLIFMCNNRLRRNCFRYRVFGMPTSKKNLLDLVKPGTKLFLFEYEARQLWGIFEATSYPGVDLENEAFRGSEIDFPLQVRFSVHKMCLPLPEKQFKKAIKENYFTLSKFRFDLNDEQVSMLTQLFCSRDLLTKHIDKSLPQISVSRSSVDDVHYHEAGRLADSKLGMPIGWERGIRGKTRRDSPHDNIRNITGFQQSPVSGVSQLDRNYHGIENLFENFEFEDDAGQSSRLNDCYKSGEHMMKDSSHLNKDWASHNREEKVEEVKNAQFCNDMNACHLRNKQSCGWGSHLHDNILEEHGETLYTGLKVKDLRVRKCGTVKPSFLKGPVPLKVSLEERECRIKELLQHEARYGGSTVANASLAASGKKGQSSENMNGLQTGQLSAGNIQRLWKRQFEDSVSCPGNTGLIDCIGQRLLDSNHSEAQRAKISRQDLFLLNRNNGVNPMNPPNHDFQKSKEASCIDGTGHMAADNRKSSALRNENIVSTSTRLSDKSANIRVTLENDIAWMDTLEDAGEMHRTDGDGRIHLKKNDTESVQKIQIQPFVRLLGASTIPLKKDNSRLSTLGEQSLLKAESNERIRQKKPTVWSRLSGRVPSTYGTTKVQTLYLEKKKQGDENDSERDYEPETSMREHDSPNEDDDIEDIEDPPRENFIVDFKRRKNIHGSQEQTKMETLTVQVNEVSKGTHAEEDSSLQSTSDVQKKRRRLIRPEIVCNNAKNVLASNDRVDKDLDASMSSTQGENC